MKTAVSTFAAVMEAALPDGRETSTQRYASDWGSGSDALPRKVTGRPESSEAGTVKVAVGIVFTRMFRESVPDNPPAVAVRDTV